MLRIYLLLAFLLSAPLSWSQENNFRYYSIEHGLSQSDIYTVFQDSRGYFWLGTDGGGISRFDGLKFMNISKKHGLAGNVVRSIIEDNNGNLWFGTDEGITVYDGIQFQNITTKEGLKSNIIIKLIEDSHNNIWAGTADGGLQQIVKLPNDSFKIKHYTTKQGLATNFIFDIHEDKYGRLWLALWNGGINILNFEKDTFDIDYLKRGFDLPSNIIISIAEDNNNNLWFGTYDEGAFNISLSGPDSGKVKPFNTSNGFIASSVWEILCDKQGTIWFGTYEHGVITYNPKLQPKNSNTYNFNHYAENQGLPSHQVLSILEDNERNMWFGTFGKGLCKLNGANFSHYSKKDGLPGSQVYSIQQDKNDNIWLASRGGGLIQMNFVNNEPIWKNYTTENGLPENNIRSISIDQNNHLWLATSESGLSRFDGKEFVTVTTEHGLVNDRMNCVLVDSKNNVWCGTNGGVSKLDSMGFRSMTENDGLPHNEVQTIIEDREGYIWFGTWNGLFKTKDRGGVSYDEVEGLLHKRIHSLAEDIQNNIWIGTFGGGLYKLDKRKDTLPITMIINDSLLSSNNIYSLIFQDDYTLIISTDKGFDKVTFDEDFRIVSVKNYNKFDGFIGEENNLNSMLKDKNNDIWFGTVTGISRYRPNLETKNNLPPKTHIAGLKLFLNDVNWQSRSDSILPWFNLPQNLELPFDQNHITFEFTSISMTSPEKVIYEYKLEPFDKQWINTSLSALGNSLYHLTLPYSNLPPGEYTFMVKAANNEGIWNTEPTTYSFVIHPPFWQTIWFYVTCAITLLIMIYGFVKVREKNLKHEKEVLEHTVAERTREVVNQKEEIEEKNNEIMDSINYAKRIQDAILPPDRLVKEHLKNSFILFKPKDVVSGDFYWMEKIDDYVMIAAVDCTGHGVPGAFVSIVGHNGLTRAVNEFGLRNPAKILDKLTELVEETFAKSESQVKDGMDIALAVINTQENSIDYAGANNPMYLLRSKKSATIHETKMHNKAINPDVQGDLFDLYQINADKQPIGAFDHRKPFTSHSFKLEKGDLMYLFSDGYPDQFGGPKGKKFKYRPFKKLLLQMHDSNMDNQKEVLDTTIEKWKGNLQQIDDICVIGVRA